MAKSGRCAARLPAGKLLHWAMSSTSTPTDRPTPGRELRRRSLLGHPSSMQESAPADAAADLASREGDDQVSLSKFIRLHSTSVDAICSKMTAR